VTSSLLAAAIGSFLWGRVFVLPATPVLLGGDQGFFWMFAERMLRGEHPYRDFFQFTPPGADLAYAAAFALCGPRIWVTSAMVVALGVGLGIVCFRLASSIVDRGLAALAAAIFTVLVFGEAINGTHHWFSALAIFAAVALLARRSSGWRILWTGALLGVGAMCTQSHGLAALSATTAFVAWQARRTRGWPRTALARSAILLAGFLLAVSALGAYFVATAGAGAVWSSLVVYVWRHMGPGAPGLGLPVELSRRSLPTMAPYLIVYALVPAAYIFAATLYWRRLRGTTSEVGDRVVLLWLVGMALLIEVATGLTWSRLLAVAMPGVVLLVWLIDRTPTIRRTVVVVAWLGVAAMGTLLVRSTQRHHPVVVSLPGGQAATDPETRDELAWLTEHVPPGSLFFAAAQPRAYLPLGVRSAVFIDAAVPTPQTRPEQVSRTIADLEQRRVRYILWADVLENADRGAQMAGLTMLREYLHSHYRPVRTFAGGDQAWERR
jgi:hypothetical protein